jgi:uncharacterized protein
MEHKYLFFLFAYLAEIIGTISGFGSSILFVPLASIFFDFKIVLGITAIFHVFSNLSKIALFRKGIDKPIILKLGIPAVLFVTLGALLTRFIPEKEIEVAMSVVLVLLSIYLIVQFNKPIQSNDRNLILGGVASGFFGRTNRYRRCNPRNNTGGVSIAERYFHRYFCYD